MSLLLTISLAAFIAGLALMLLGLAISGRFILYLSVPGFVIILLAGIGILAGLM